MHGLGGLTWGEWASLIAIITFIAGLISLLFKYAVFAPFRRLALKGAINTDYLSDGAHTFEELYYHRAVLFALSLNKYTSGTYRSKLHRDGTMFEGMLVVGVKTPAGHYPYHFPLDY